MVGSERDPGRSKEVNRERVLLRARRLLPPCFDLFAQFAGEFEERGEDARGWMERPRSPFLWKPNDFGLERVELVGIPHSLPS